MNGSVQIRNTVSVLSKTISRYRHNYRTRRQLLKLNDTALKDIGISRAEALQEAKKPFWRNDQVTRFSSVRILSRPVSLTLLLCCFGLLIYGG